MSTPRSAHAAAAADPTPPTATATRTESTDRDIETATLLTQSATKHLAIRQPSTSIEPSTHHAPSNSPTGSGGDDREADIETATLLASTSNATRTHSRSHRHAANRESDAAAVTATVISGTAQPAPPVEPPRCALAISVVCLLAVLLILAIAPKQIFRIDTALTIQPTLTCPSTSLPHADDHVQLQPHDQPSSPIATPTLPPSDDLLLNMNVTGNGTVNGTVNGTGTGTGFIRRDTPSTDDPHCPRTALKPIGAESYSNSSSPFPPLQGYIPSVTTQSTQSECPLASAYMCVDPCCDNPLQRNRSCTWRNLFYVDKQYIALVVDPSGQDATWNAANFQALMAMRTPVAAGTPRGDINHFIWGHKIFAPTVMRFVSCEALTQHVLQTWPALYTLEGESVMMLRANPYNWGHHMLDDFYPLYLAFTLFHPPDTPFHLIIAETNGMHNTPGKWPTMDEMTGTFSGHPLEFTTCWNVTATRQEAVLIHSLTYGAAQKGARSTNRQYELRQHNHTLQHFRDRFYRQYGVPLVSRADVQKLPGHTFNVYLIKNKRDLGDLRTHAAVISKLSTSDVKVSARVVDLSQYSTKQQLELFSQCDVLISGVGTSLTSLFFLPTHTALINVGDVRGGGIVGYWEENIQAAADWQQSFYYPPDRRRAGVTSDELARLVSQAIGQLRAGLTLPVSGPSNASPIGLAFRDYADRMPDVPAYMTADLATSKGKDDVICLLDAWAELVMCQYGPWKDKAACGPIDQALMDRLHEKYQLRTYCSA